MNAGVVLAKRWRLAALGAAIAVAAVLWRLLDDPIAVPGRTDVAAAVSPLVPVLVVLALIDSAATLMETIEVVAARSRMGRAILHMALFSVAVAVLLVVDPPSLNDHMIVRNAVFLMGAGYGLLALLTRTQSLLVVAMTPLIMWLVGSRPGGAAPVAWAVLLQDSTSASADLAALVAGVVGPSLFMAAVRR